MQEKSGNVPMEDYQIMASIVGLSGVGKSSIVKVMKGQAFEENTHTPTKEIERSECMVDVSLKKVKFIINDTPGGQSNPTEITACHFRGVSVLFFACAKDDQSSLTDICAYLAKADEVAGETTIKVLVATKNDKEEKITQTELEKFKRERDFDMLYVVSATKANEILTMMKDVCEAAVEKFGHLEFGRPLGFIRVKSDQRDVHDQVVDIEASNEVEKNGMFFSCC